jgi:transposase
MAKLGEDVTEVLDYVPGHFQVIRHVRPKYACTACDAITQAPAPAMPTPRGRATPATLAHLLVSKYCDHLPLYRQSEIYAREGLELDRSTLGDWVGQAAWLLDPMVAAIRGMSSRPRRSTATTRRCRCWRRVSGGPRPDGCGSMCATTGRSAAKAPPAAAYFYSPDRGGEHPAAHMASFTGLLQADGYAGFEALYNPARTKPGPITEVACWAHCRRKFFDVWEATKSPVAKEALDRIAAIYAIEDKARFAPAAERVNTARDGAAARGVLRLGQSDRGQAVGQVGAGRGVPLHDQAARSTHALRHRRAARGRQQHRRERDARHRARTEELSVRRFGCGGERAASIYTLVQTAKLNG